MAKYRQAARIDDNQNDIVNHLRALGVSVETNHDDILVGYMGKTYWFEIKDPAKTKKKDGTFKAGAVKPSQVKLLREWKGHYQIVCYVEEILMAVGYEK